MSDFFWTSGHLGWGVFALIVFTCFWWLLADLIWRLRSIRVHNFAILMALGWLIGVVFILLGFYFCSC